MIRWFKSLSAWRAIRNSSVWLYEQNEITGQRRATLISGCYQPLDWDFLRDGDVVNGRKGQFIVGTESQIRFG